MAASSNKVPPTIEHKTLPVPVELLQDVLNYLEHRPYNESAHLIHRLLACNITVQAETPIEKQDTNA